MGIRIWVGGRIGMWRMWGITFRGQEKWWFIGVSREYKSLDTTVDDAIAGA